MENVTNTESLKLLKYGKKTEIFKLLKYGKTEISKLLKYGKCYEDGKIFFRRNSIFNQSIKQSINLFVYSPSDTERAVTAKLKHNNAICSVDVFTLIMSLVH